MTRKTSSFTSRISEQAEMLANRLRKRARVVDRWAKREGLTAYRLYNNDIPEVRAFIDRYEDLIHVSVQPRHLSEEAEWLDAVGAAVSSSLGVPPERVLLKVRRPRVPGFQYGRMGKAGKRLVVRERELQFLVNLTDYVDTGLFLHHRETRALVRKMSPGLHVLNLFCYTGGFSCAAAAGEAASTQSVDLSRTYLDWFGENLRLNRLAGPAHGTVRADAFSFLQRAAAQAEEWDLAIVDPPTFSNSTGSGQSFDVQRDHRELLGAVFEVIAPGGAVLFSTNRREFVPEFDGLPLSGTEDISDATTPFDFRGPAPHRAWLLHRSGTSRPARERGKRPPPRRRRRH